MNQQDLKSKLLEEAAYYDTPLNDLKLKSYAFELADLSELEFLGAVKFYRRQPGRTRMPLPADYISAAQSTDGRPHANAAWAMIPRSEADSVVWTEEMRLSYSDAAALLDQGDKQGAFFTFKASYDQLVAENRMNRVPPKWSMSPGHSVSGRESAVLEAVSKGRFSLERGLEIFPEIEYNPQFRRLAAAQNKPISQIENSGNNRLQNLIATTHKGEF